MLDSRANPTFGGPDLPNQLLEDVDLPAPSTDEPIAVDLGVPALRANEGGALISELGDGSIEVDFGEGEEDDSPGFDDDHNANLAEGMIESTLNTIAAEIIEWVEQDVKDRESWHERLAEGLELLGVTNEKQTGPFKLTEKVNHPLIGEAVVQFQARAIAELVPAGGPAKCLVLGEKTRDLEEQAQRVADYQNYHLMVEDPDFFPEFDRLLAVLARNGSQFKKVYHDPLADMDVSRWVRGEDFIVPYGVTTLRSAPRYTHQIEIERNDMRKLQAAGWYRKVALATPTEGATRAASVQEANDKAQGQNDGGKFLLEDTPHTVYECHCDYDVPGLEDRGPTGSDGKPGEPTGIGLPYVIAVDKETRTVLSIRRNWKETDEKRKKRVWFVHYPFLPGDGFYSYGYVHTIGGLGRAATGLLRIIMLGAAFASMRGGYKSKDAKLGSDNELEFGVYKETDMTHEELTKAFYEPKFAGPDESMFKILGLITEAGSRFASTVDVMVGDATNTGPVGTTVALIEEGKKVFSGIHKRLHIALGEELKLLAELHGENIPEEGYPYNVHGASRQIFREDFDDRVDVMPVSDPNISSSTQRIAVAQAVTERAAVMPQLYDLKKVEKRFLEAMRVPEPDELLVQAAKTVRTDPVTENALMIVGKPARAFIDQDHQAHIAVHMDQLHRMEAEQSPLLERVAPIFMAHIAEHTAYGVHVQASQQMGIQLPPIDLSADGDAPPAQDLPPQIESAIAQRAAMVVQQNRQMAAQAAQQQAGAQGSPEADLQAQAEDLQKQAAELEQARAEFQRQQENAALKQAYEKRESALRAKLEKVQGDARNQKVNETVQGVLDEAVRRVEEALKSGGAKQ